MVAIDYYFDKTCKETIPAVKSGIIPYSDLKILLEHEKNHKNRVTIIRAIEKQLSKLKELNRETTRKELKIERLKALNKAQEKELDLVDRIANTVKASMGNIPDIEPPKIHQPKKGHKAEKALLLLSDSHIGKETKTYNPTVFRQRLDNLKESMMSIISGLRNIRPIKKLIIVMNGDKTIMSPKPANSVKIPTP